MVKLILTAVVSFTTVFAVEFIHFVDRTADRPAITSNQMLALK